LLLAIATVVIFVLSGLRSQTASMLGVGGTNMFSIGIILWRTEPQRDLFTGKSW